MVIYSLCMYRVTVATEIYKTRQEWVTGFYPGVFCLCLILIIKLQNIFLTFFVFNLMPRHNNA